MCQIDIKNRIRQKRPKKPNFIWPFFKNKKSQRNWKKAQNYEFGLKIAKLATLAPRVFAQQTISLTHFKLHCYRIYARSIRRPWLTFVNALANSILGRFYTARTQKIAACAWPMVWRKLGNRWKWKGESWFHYTNVLFVGVVGIAEMWFYLVLSEK